jgi:hypothetical protein
MERRHSLGVLFLPDFAENSTMPDRDAVSVPRAAVGGDEVIE